MNEDMRHNAEQIRPCITPLLVYPRSADSASDLKCGGTAFFVRSGATDFLVTAYHVYQHIESLGHEFFPVIVPSDGRGVVDISSWSLVSGNEFVDIAVFRVPDEFEIQSIGKVALTYRASPATRIQEGEAVFFMGFPGQHRIATTSKLTYGMVPVMDSVTSVNSRAFLLSDDLCERISTGIEPVFGELKGFGGFSGSPMLTVRSGLFELVGVFIEGCFEENGIHALFRGAHFDLVKADGGIDEARIPY